MDISTLVAAPRVVDIKHPATGAPIGLKVTLRPDSAPEVLAEKRKLLNERLRHDVKATAERLEENSLTLLGAAVAGWEWEGDLTFEGSKPDFTPANLRKVLVKLRWVREQLDDEFGEDAAFFESSATS